MRVNLRDVVGGVLLMALGVFVAFYAQRYKMGSLVSMGPGYFPTVLGILLVVFGALIALPALFQKGEGLRLQLRNLCFVISSLIVFAFGLETLGMVITTFLTIFLATLATRVSLRFRIGLSLGGSLLTYLVFIFALKMLVPVWPTL